MIQFERSRDYELIRSVMTHPSVYPYIADDASPSAAEYRPIESEAIWYIEARDTDRYGCELLGFWIFHPHNAVCWEVHTALLPNAWGPVAQEAARLLPAWIWKHTPCRRIITNVPTTNRLALHFAFKAGMKMFGVNVASYLKNGKLCDQICLGISESAEMPFPEAETGQESIPEGPDNSGGPQCPQPQQLFRP